MPSGSWNRKGVNIHGSEYSDSGYAYQSLYQPVKGSYPNQHRAQNQQERQDGFSLESHHFMDLSRVLKEVEDEGSLIPSPTRLLDRKRRLSDDVVSPEDLSISEDFSVSEDFKGNDRHSIEQIKNTYSISLDSLNDNLEVSCRIHPDSFTFAGSYDSDQTPTVDKSFWSESDDDSPVVEGSSCYFDDTPSETYLHLPPNSFGRLDKPTNINDYLPPCDQDLDKELHNISVVSESYDENGHKIIEEVIEEDNVVDDDVGDEGDDVEEEDSVDEAHSCTSHEATSTASSESLQSAYSLQTPALSSSPESYEMLYRSFEVAMMVNKEQNKSGVDISHPSEESPLDILNKSSPKLQRVNYQRELREGSEDSSSKKSSLSPVHTPSTEVSCTTLHELASIDQEQPFILDLPSSKAHSAEDLTSSKVITFAQIAQQRKRPTPNQPKKQDNIVQETQLHWTELLSKGSTPSSSSSSSQDISGAGAQCEGQEQPDAPRRPQSLPIQLRHLQKPTIRLHATPPKLPLPVSRTMSAPEGSTTQSTGSGWGEFDEGIGELSESDNDLSPDPVNVPSPVVDAATQSLSPLLRQDEIEFGGLVPRRPRTTTWCGSFGASRRSLFSSREGLSDTDSLDLWQPTRPKDINANLPSRARSQTEADAKSISALYDARDAPIEVSRKDSLTGRDSFQRSRKRHYCKDTYAARTSQNGGVFISGTENKPFLLQNLDSKDKSVSFASKTRSLPRNMGVARRRATAGGSNGRSRPKSMEGLSSFSSGFDVGDLAAWTENLKTLTKSKSQEEQLSDAFHKDPEEEMGACAAIPGVSAVQQRWNETDEADYASLNSSLLMSPPVSADCKTHEELKYVTTPVAPSTSTSLMSPSSPSPSPSKSSPFSSEKSLSKSYLSSSKSSPSLSSVSSSTSLDERCSIIPSSESSSSCIIRIDNVAKDAEVKYIHHRPLKPIRQVDAEHHRKKVLERLSILQQTANAPPSCINAPGCKTLSHPTAATKISGATTSQPKTVNKRHRRQKSDAVAAAAIQSLTKSEVFWSWAIGREPVRGKRMSSVSDKASVTLGTSGQQAGRLSGIRSQLRPLALNVAHDDLESMPPQLMEVSPRDQEQALNTYIVQKRALVAEVNAAVDQLLAHFAKAKSGSPEEKARLGNTWRTPDVGHLTLHYLCPALMNILQDGLRSHSTSLLVGRIKNTTWTIVEATTQIGPGTRLLHELALTVSKDIRLRDSKLRTHAFFLGLLNIRCLETWLDHIKTHPDSVKRFYEPSGFLNLCASAPYQQLFDDLLLAVQPLAQLPFNLDHGFEYGSIQAETMRQREQRQMMEQHKSENTTMPASHEATLNSNNMLDARLQNPEGGRASSGIGVNLFGRAPRRDGVRTQRPVSTGMYSSMTVNRDNRRITPVGKPDSPEKDGICIEGPLRSRVTPPTENVSGYELERGVIPRQNVPQVSQSNRWSLGWIKDFAASVSPQSERVMWSRPVGQPSTRSGTGSVVRRSKSVDVPSPVQGLGSAFSMGWGKLGASFSKMWNNVTATEQAQEPQETTKEVPSTTPMTPGLEVRHGGDGESPSQYYSPITSPGTPVKALCHHVTMSEGELCFSKGDVLTVNRRVDPDWLLCSHGNESGLVHIEYVQGME